MNKLPLIETSDLAEGESPVIVSTKSPSQSNRMEIPSKGSGGGIGGGGGGRGGSGGGGDDSNGGESEADSIALLHR